MATITLTILNTWNYGILKTGMDWPGLLPLFFNSSHLDSASVSWKSRVIGFGHAELNIGDADTTEIARLYRGHIPVL
jgi:hypothetical protein